MKVGYYIKRCSGDVYINIVSDGKLLRHGTADNMNVNMEVSYKPLEGFTIVGRRLDLIVQQ